MRRPKNKPRERFVCASCGTDHAKFHPSQKYCSDACRQRAHYWRSREQPDAILTARAVLYRR
jgi:predicted nucleic acid-binding Zn ribbon protein